MIFTAKTQVKLLLITALLVGVNVSFAVHAAISIVDTGGSGDVIKPPKKITWYTIDTPFRQETSVKDYDELVPVQNYKPNVTPELRYFLPPKSYRIHTGDIAQRCRNANKVYAGRLGAFFMLANNSHGFNISTTEPNTDIAIAPAQSGGFSFWQAQSPNCTGDNECTLPNGMIEQLIHSPYAFESPYSDLGLRFPYVFATVTIAEKQLKIMERGRFNPYQPLMMTVHHPSTETPLMTSTMLEDTSGTNGIHAFVYLDQGGAETYVKHGVYTLKPYFEDRKGGVNRIYGNPEYRRQGQLTKPVDVASQAHIFVACQEKPDEE